MKEKEKDEDVLAGFQWDATDGSEDFFGQKVDNNETSLTDEEKEQVKQDAIEAAKKEEEDDKVLEPKKEETPEEKAAKEETEQENTEEKPKEEKEIKFFEEETENNEENEEVEDDFFNKLAGGMKEKGVFTTVDIPEEGNLSEEDYVNLHEQEIEARVDETFKGFFEEMDDDGKAFLKFKKEGGNTKEFFDVLRSTTALPDGDISDETHQEKVIRHYSSVIDEMDEEEITDRIAWLDESGKTEKYAKKYDIKLKEIDKKQKEFLVQKTQNASEAEAEVQKTFQKNLKKQLEGVESIKNIPFTKEDKAELFNFITRPTVKVGKNKYITGFQEALKKISTDNETLILLAKLVKSDFDFSSVTVKARTKETQKLRKTLERTQKNSKPTTARGSSNKELSDYFD